MENGNPAISLHSSNEPRELSKQLCYGRHDSTTKIVEVLCYNNNNNSYYYYYRGGGIIPLPPTPGSVTAY